MSRLYRLGTIFSRVDGLIRKGVIKENDKPLWYDVYARFPPDYEPDYIRPVLDNKIPEIFYPEDEIRAKIHKEFSKRPFLVDLNSDEKTNSMKYIEAYKKYTNQGMTKSEALEKIMENVNKQMSSK